MINKFLEIFKKNNSLSKVVFINIIGSYFFHGISLLVGFFSVPYLLQLLTDNQYGVWITIFSILNWFTYLDFGINQGLRNKLPAILKNKNNNEIKTLIESAYFVTILVSIFIFFSVAFLSLIFDFKFIFNLIDYPIPENINSLVLTVFFLFGFQFSTNNIVGILHATLESRYVTLIDALSKSIMFSGILVLLYLEMSSLYLLAVITILSRVIFLSFFTYRFTKKINLKLKLFQINNFSEKFVNLKNHKALLFNSLEFFIIGLSTIFLLNSTNFLITYWYSPAEVIPFSISFKLFSILLILFYLFLAPFWSAITDAFVRNDRLWISNILKKMVLFYIIFVILVLIIYAISPLIYDFWIGNDVVISNEINFAVLFYIIITSWNALFAHFLNGINKLNLQVKISIFHIVTNIPFCWLLSVYFDFGIVGIVWATNLNLLILTVFLPFQCYTFLKTSN